MMMKERDFKVWAAVMFFTLMISGGLCENGDELENVIKRGEFID